MKKLLFFFISYKMTGFFVLEISVINNDKYCIKGGGKGCLFLWHGEVWRTTILLNNFLRQY